MSTNYKVAFLLSSLILSNDSVAAFPTSTLNVGYYFSSYMQQKMNIYLDVLEKRINEFAFSL